MGKTIFHVMPRSKDYMIVISIFYMLSEISHMYKEIYIYIKEILGMGKAFAKSKPYATSCQLNTLTKLHY